MTHTAKGPFEVKLTAVREPRLSVTVVPDSGTGELAGISGTMKIVIGPKGEHSYELECVLSG